MREHGSVVSAILGWHAAECEIVEVQLYSVVGGEFFNALLHLLNIRNIRNKHCAQRQMVNQ